MSRSPYLLLATVVWFLACPWALWPTFAPALTALSLTLLLALRLGVWWRRGYPLLTTPLDSFLFFYLVAVTLAILVSPAPSLGLPKLTTVALGVFGYYLVQEWLADSGHHRYLHLLLALAGGAIALIAPFIIEWPARQIIDLRFLYDRVPHLSGDFRAHSNEVGGTLLFLFPFSVALWKSEHTRAWSWRWIGAVLALIVLGGLFLSQSRGRCWDCWWPRQRGSRGGDFR